MVKSFVIILQESLHSQKIGKDCIESANKFGIFPEIHNGVNGFDSYRYFKEYNITRFLCRTIIDFPGHQGCFLSHFQLWKKCVEINETILILEHDSIFVRPLPETILFNDILFLDPFCPYSEGYEDNVNNSLSKDVSYFRPTGDHWHAVGEHLSGAYAYLIKPHAAKKLIDFAVNIGAAPTDIHMGRNIVDLESTTVTIARLHKYYNTDIKDKSSTENLSQYVSGTNQMIGSVYLSPKKFLKLTEN